MIDVQGELSAGIPARGSSHIPRAVIRDSSARDAAREAAADLSKAAAVRRAATRIDAQLARIAAEIVRSVESRLPGRVRDLDVRVEPDQFVLSGISSSYYVKQVAQHVAMTALDAVMLGRLVNEIEVRTVR